MLLNNFTLFLISVLIVVIFYFLINYNMFIDAFISIELIWLFFFLFVNYLNIFRNDTNLIMFIYLIICFATFELITLLMILQIKK